MLYVIEVKLRPMWNIATTETYLGLLIHFPFSKNHRDLKLQNKKITQIEFSQNFQGTFL